MHVWRNVHETTQERRNEMSMDSDCRLIMMALREKATRPERARPRKTNFKRYSATAAAAVAAFALTLFTRSA